MEYRTTLGMLSVLAVGGKEIKGGSMLGTVSPYIAFQIDHMKKKTKVSKGKGKNPKWNDLIEFEIIKGRDTLNGKVMGKEISEDEFIGDIKVDLKPIFKKGYAEMWVPVIHPHKNRHKGDVFLKLQYKPSAPDPMLPPPGPPMGARPPMGPRPPMGTRPPMGQRPPMGVRPPPPMGPPGSPMRPPQRPPLQRSATAPLPVGPPGPQGPPGPIPPRQGSGVPPQGLQGPPPQGPPGPIPPRQGSGIPPVNIPPRGASPSVRPHPSPVPQFPQRQGSGMDPRARPPPPNPNPNFRQVEEPQSYNGEIKHAMTTNNSGPPPSHDIPLPVRSQTYNPPPPHSPNHQMPPRQHSHPQINTTAPGISPRVQAARSPRPVSPNPNPNGPPINIPQRMQHQPLGPRPN
ncbi:hypothetical protein BCR32DRAFT_296508 [Anaeromyces robustus]|uniref:C2 domain-containing protein n=1 Tax=Anaeromyces robustus TaxID=1754192 RepID=A0A1Y1WSE2_9FUNG|nr:hypothetical protein BCR32DRAFT_296508 [Anaeromyces robustus]|eukprot:ORX76054.1 hypothetical protein BCR32DRAFT_296508 [Anaeromyces robustus]